MKSFDSLNEREILALAISLEAGDERLYADFSEGFREIFPATSSVFDAMREDKIGHRQRLISLYREKFGDHIPLIRRQDVKRFVQRNREKADSLNLFVQRNWARGYGFVESA